MTAPIASSANLMNGIREMSQVTNSYGFYLQSAGVAYDVTLPFMPDRIDWFNYTKFGTNDNNVSGVWFRDFPAGDALIVARGTTTLTSTLEATNGITDISTDGGFVDQHVTITGITTATPPVVTAASHGLATGDRIIITKVVGTMAAEVNNKEFVVNVLTANTFSLYDVYGNPIAIVGAYTSGGQLVKEGPELGVVNVAPAYIFTLGSAVMGADNDVIYFTAWKFNNYVNYGDVV